MPMVEVHEKVNIVEPLIGKVMIYRVFNFDLQDDTQFMKLQFEYYAKIRVRENGKEKVESKS